MNEDLGYEHALLQIGRCGLDLPKSGVTMADLAPPRFLRHWWVCQQDTEYYTNHIQMEVNVIMQHSWQQTCRMRAWRIALMIVTLVDKFQLRKFDRFKLHENDECNSVVHMQFI